MHEFMSDHEIRYFYLMLWADEVIDIREQYPILEVEAVIKPSKDLEKKRVIEKFEIERAYYETKGTDWGIVTEKEKETP